MSAPHAAVKHELLVRYLDAWTPAVLHGHKRVTFVAGCRPSADSALAALRVFGEFADLLERHTLLMLLAWPARSDAGVLDQVRHRLVQTAAEYGSPAGLVISTSVDPLPSALADAGATGSPVFGWFNDCGTQGPAVDAVAAVAGGSRGIGAGAGGPSGHSGNHGSEVLLALAAGVAVDPYRHALAEAGLALTCQVDLVDAGGVVERVLFATAAEKNLQQFKDELWALDEFAGIQLRDPTDPDRTLLNISEQPQIGPLRRALAAQVLHTGGATLAQLRTWAQHETVYRPADATRAVHALVATGTVERDPVGGRLSADTMIRPAGGPVAAGVPGGSDD